MRRLAWVRTDMRKALRAIPGGWIVTAIALAPGAERLSAQGPEPGSRLRLTVPCEAGRETSCRVVGKLISAGGDSLTLTAAGGRQRHALRDLLRLERSDGRRSHWLLGAGLGFAAGAVATYALLHTGGSTSVCDRSANQDAVSTTECLGLAALGGVGGAGLGAVVGGLIRTERWRELPLAGLRIGMTGGTRPTLAWHWPTRR